MRCYEHPDVEAVGVCTECGRGTCQACSVMIGGKLYCKEDADRVFGGVEQDEEEGFEGGDRAISITVSSIMLILYSIGGVAFSIVLIAIGLFIGSFASIPVFAGAGSQTAAVVSYVPLGAGVVVLVISVIALISGWQLWKSKVGGAWLGLGPVIASMIMAGLLVALFRSIVTLEIAGLLIGYNLVVGLLIILGWNSLSNPTVELLA